MASGSFSGHILGFLTEQLTAPEKNTVQNVGQDGNILFILSPVEFLTECKHTQFGTFSVFFICSVWFETFVSFSEVSS